MYHACICIFELCRGYSRVGLTTCGGFAGADPPEALRCGRGFTVAALFSASGARRVARLSGQRAPGVGVVVVVIARAGTGQVSKSISSQRGPCCRALHWLATRVEMVLRCIRDCTLYSERSCERERRTEEASTDCDARPLAGMSFTVKDCIDVAGTPTVIGLEVWLHGETRVTAGNAR